MATLGRLPNLFCGRVPPAVADVRGDGSVEQENVLLDDAEQAAIALNLNLAQVAAVQENASRRRIVEPSDQVAERRLAGAAGADQGDRLTGLDIERSIVLQAPAAPIRDSGSTRSRT